MPETLENVHIYEMDRSTSRLELVRKNPTRSFAEATPRGMALYTWQNGHWFGTGGNPLAPEDVPEKYRQRIAETPVTFQNEGAAITATCRICSQTMNSSEMEEHLLRHVQETMERAGTIQQAEDRTPKKRAES